MTLDFKVLQKVKGNPSTEVAPGRRLKSVPDQDYEYDLPKELIYKIHQEFQMEGLFNPDGETSREYLANQGRSFMNLLIQEADSKEFLDRTGEMIEQVAQQTGIRFPHVLERYIELGILSLRPRDAWTVTEATTKTLNFRSFNCSLGKLFAAQGINDCQVFCMAANEVAAQKAGTVVTMAHTKDTSGSGLCEMAFHKQQGG